VKLRDGQRPVRLCVGKRLEDGGYLGAVMSPAPEEDEGQIPSPLAARGATPASADAAAFGATPHAHTTLAALAPWACVTLMTRSSTRPLPTGSEVTPHRHGPGNRSFWVA
jgi:hypothetical protein